MQGSTTFEASTVFEASTAFEESLEGIAALHDPVRRRLYRYIAARGHAVGRHEAATALGLNRSTAAAQLDRLVSLGLLEVEYRRLGERTGPGAGRPSKLYRRAARDLSVSLPPRRYLLAAEILAAAVASGEQRPISERVAGAAQRAGRAIGEAAGLGSATDGRERLLVALAEHGFEPRVEGGEVELGNCPFHDLAARFTELVCVLNLQLLSGLAEGCTGVEPRLSPQPGACCVRLALAPGGGSSSNHQERNDHR